jgi:hypothetical protein
MKIPRILTDRLGKWLPLALLVLPVLAARTLIVASEERDGSGAPAKSPTRFIMSDGVTEAHSAPRSDLLDSSAASNSDAPFYTDSHAPSAQPAMIQLASPVVREAARPIWEADENQSFWDASWQTSDPGEQALDAVPFAEPYERFDQSGQSAVQQAYNAYDEDCVNSHPLAEGSTESNPTQFTVQPSEDRVARLLYQEAPELPPSLPASGTPQGFAVPEAIPAPQDDATATPADTATIAPVMSAPAEAPEIPPAPVTPQEAQIDTPQGPLATDIPASPSDATAPLPTVQGQLPAAVPPTRELPAAALPSEQPALDAAPFAPEPEAFPSDPYGLMPEGAAFEQPAMPADCGMACPLSWYARAEILYVQRRTEDHISLTDNDLNGLDRMDFTPGARIAFGRIGDCLDGFEVVYTGGFEWTERSRITGTNLNPKFKSDEFDISSFRNAEVHTQEYRSDFHSAELNRKWWGWDVISTTVGIRYMYVGDKYRFDSSSAQNGIGSLKMAMDNHYIGPQLGLDLYKPIGRWTTEMRSKAGVFLNYIDFDYSLVNDGVSQFNVGSEKGQLGFEAEIGFYAQYQLLPRLSIQAGYELWYLYGVATATSQDRSRIWANDGAYSKDDIFYHGGSIGVEMVW